MKARYQYRFYPTDQQRQSLAQLFGCCRVVWNDALALCQQSEKLPGFNQLSAALTQAKKTEERKWLTEVSSVPLQQSLRKLDVAYKNFFSSLKGKRKGKKVGTPNFKKKTNQQSAEFTKAGFSIKDSAVYLAKIGSLNPIWSRELPSEPSSVTVIKDCAGRYFLSFVVEVNPNESQATRVAPLGETPRRASVAGGFPSADNWHPHSLKNQSIGIDLGIKTFAVMSNGEKVESPNYSNTDRKIRRLQRKLARQQKDSNRRNKTRVQIAKLHNQIADTRKDFFHKLSTKVINKNQTIVLEDLNVSGMVKNRKLARAISLQGWREFRNLCEAKSEKMGREFRVISRWEPTSQVGSDCGFKWGKLDLSVRELVCLNCGVQHNRDANAAKNIEMVGMGHRYDLKRTQRDGQTASVAQLDEALRITVA